MSAAFSGAINVSFATGARLSAHVSGGLFSGSMGFFSIGFSRGMLSVFLGAIFQNLYKIFYLTFLRNFRMSVFSLHARFWNFVNA